jgi:hypothetical protein
MTLPSYAMNQTSFPEMYERWLVGPLFRPWAELTLDEVKLAARRSRPGYRLRNWSRRACRERAAR